MALTASALRQNIYVLLDQVLKTGVPLEIKRKRRKLRIIPMEKTNRLSNLKRRNIMQCLPEELVHMDWSKEWKP